MIGFSSNAASAKVRGMLGKCLKAADYKILCSCRTVDEVASILRQTPYGKLMEPGVMHREQIERAVSRRIYFEMEGLRRYLPDDGGYLGEYFLGRHEVEQIVKAATRLNGTAMYEPDGRAPTEFAAKSHIKLYILAVAKTKQDILTAVKGTVYEACARSFEDDDGMTVPQFEASLWSVLYAKVRSQAQKHASGAELEYMQKLFARRVDVMNYITLCRMKRYGDVSAEYLRSLMIHGGTLSEGVTEKMLRAEDREALYDAVRKSHIGRSVGEDDVFTVPVNEYVRYMRYCPYPTVVVAAYLFFVENETSNIIKITEGIRYSLDSGDIYGMLSIAE